MWRFYFSQEMKNQHILIVLLSFILSGCANHDFDIRKQILAEYGQDFINIYGEPCSTQTWNTAIQYQIQVSNKDKTETKINVYSCNPINDEKRAFILGSFESIEEETFLNVDIPYTLQSIYIGFEQDENSYIEEILVDKNMSMITIENDKFQYGILPSVPEMSYLLLFETGDDPACFDFNDIVVKITHSSGQETADISLLAVGTTKTMSLVYDDETLFSDVLKSFNIYNLKHTVNVKQGQHNDSKPVIYKSLYVGKDFSICNDLSKFILTETNETGKTITYKAWPKDDFYLGMPTQTILVSNPNWDWVSEGHDISKEYPNFVYWLKTDRLYNDWWDTMWDKKDLISINGSFQPNYDYKDLVLGDSEISRMDRFDISHELLSKFKTPSKGMDLAFVIVGRKNESVRVNATRNDNKQFEWYTGDATILVSGNNTNVDYGGGNAEACHILLSKADIESLKKNKANLSIQFDHEAPETYINSVWAREHK